MFVKSEDGSYRFDPQHHTLLREAFNELRPNNKTAIFGLLVSFADFTPEARTAVSTIMADILGVDTNDKDYSLTDALESALAFFK